MDWKILFMGWNGICPRDGITYVYYRKIMNRPIFEEVILLLGWFKNRLTDKEFRIITDRITKDRGTIDEKMWIDLKVTKGKMEREDNEP